MFQNGYDPVSHPVYTVRSSYITVTTQTGRLGPTHYLLSLKIHTYLTHKLYSKIPMIGFIMSIRHWFYFMFMFVQQTQTYKSIYINVTSTVHFKYLST